MLIYIEKQAKDYSQTKKILEKFKNAEVIFIDNYKNIFDKSYENLSSKKALIIAKLNSNPITEAPSWYGHTKNAYFFKTSLNCIFDCSYCYLKGLFKNENMVIFVNYEDIKNSIKMKVEEQTSPQPSPLGGEGDCTSPQPSPLEERGLGGEVWFYSWDYSDVVWMDVFSGFIEEFVPFFEEFKTPPLVPPLIGEGNNKENINNDSESSSEWQQSWEGGIMMEIRTKSANIKPLLDLWFVPKNTEIAFSLNPQDLIEKYEKWTSSLDDRIKAVNILLEKWFKVWLRFLPLLPVKNYEEKYKEFVEYIKENIDMCKIYSTFASGLLYTKKDYNKIFKKYRDLDILHMLELEDGDFYRESRKVRDTLYWLFKDLDKGCIFCLEN